MSIQLEIQYPWVAECERFDLIEISFSWIDTKVLVLRLLGIGLVIKF